MALVTSDKRDIPPSEPLTCSYLASSVADSLPSVAFYCPRLCCVGRQVQSLSSYTVRYMLDALLTLQVENCYPDPKKAALPRELNSQWLEGFHQYISAAVLLSLMTSWLSIASLQNTSRRISFNWH